MANSNNPPLRSPRKTGGKPTGYNVTFANIRLTRDHVTHMREQGWDVDQLLSQLLLLAEQGYKVSVSPDGPNNSYIATLVGKATQDGNQGKGLSGRGSDPVEALRSLFYKHFIICDGGDWPTAEPSGDLEGYG